MGKASRSKQERRNKPLLYHFTSRMHLPVIEATGFLNTTESNLSFKASRVGPDVVWLLDTESADDYPHGLTGIVDKTAVRITVRTNAVRWTEWVKRQPGYDPVSAAVLVETGGGPEAASHWWVAEHPIPRSEWVDVETRS